MDYKHHMMTKKCIRIHAMTHFRRHIVKEMLINQNHSSSHNRQRHDSYACYICGVRDSTSSYIINHLGVYHKRLDFYNKFILDEESLNNTRESSGNVTANLRNSEQNKKTGVIVDDHFMKDCSIEEVAKMLKIKIEQIAILVWLYVLIFYLDI